MDDQEYAGFFIRVGAAIVDTIILLVLTVPILYLAYGGGYWESDALVHGPLDLLVSYILPAVAVILTTSLPVPLSCATPTSSE